MKGGDRFTQAESAVIRTSLSALRRAERPIQKSIRGSLRRGSRFYISRLARSYRLHAFRFR